MDCSEQEEQLACRRILAYDAAWNAHDLPAVLAMHTDDSVFQSHTTGELATGKPQIGTMINRLWRLYPDLRFEIRRMYARQGLVVQEWTAVATHTRSIPGRGRAYRPTGEVLRWLGVDVIPLRDGLILRKDAYVDTAALQRQLEKGRSLTPERTPT
ncbi:MAG: nuclear transport factor 2 family protein [Deltaproteobacteria bacterium]|nr:nuclear transport factor 2 family protein [Deltaproteobacteria bacterium]